MRFLQRSLGLLVLLLLIPVLTAQDAEKDPPKEEKKDVKEPKKKAEAKPAEPELVYGQQFSGKLKNMDANSLKNFSVELQLPDPKKIYDLNVWKAQQMVAINKEPNPFARQKRVVQYQFELAKRQTGIYSPKDIELRAGDAMKVRSLYPPAEYDDKGNLKKYTIKELQALKGASKLPGYPVEYDALRPGQMVQVYLAKPQAPTKKGGLADRILGDDPNADPTQINRAEVVMIVIAAEPLPVLK